MPRAVGLTEQILGAYKMKVASLEIVPSGGGVFEVDLNGQRIFSKKELDRFPEFDEIAEHLEKAQ
jgi:selenoprotein W-related protein